MSKFWPNGSASIPIVTSEFGWRIHPNSGVRAFHYGIDLVGFPNNCAADNGTVTFARANGGAGNEVRVLHDDGTETRYKHNARFLVGEGARVVRGQPLGVMGTTGDSTGVHCHFETRNTPNGAAINPRQFITAYNLAGLDSEPIDEKETPMLILRSNGAGTYAKAGSMYRRDYKTGAWRELTNLEGNILVPKLVANGAVLHDFDVNEIEIMFAVDGLVETNPVPEVTWGGKKTPLKGGGSPTGNVIFP